MSQPSVTVSPQATPAAYFQRESSTETKVVGGPRKHGDEAGPLFLTEDESGNPLLSDLQYADIPLSVSDVIRFGAEHCSILRRDSDFGSVTNQLLSNPGAIGSEYDIAIADAGYLFGSRGVEAALADFDAQFTTTMNWGRNETIQNNMFLSGGINPGETLVQETAGFSASLQKTLRSGGTISLRQDWNYDGDNSTNRLFQSAYSGSLSAEFRQPLMAGHGAEVTGVAGPIGTRLEGVGGLGQGVTIAELRGQQAALQYRAQLNEWVRDVRTAYWRLVGARYVDEQARNTAKITDRAWENFQNRVSAGEEGSGTAEEAEFREFVLDARVRRVQANQDLLDADARLRRLIGMPDGATPLSTADAAPDAPVQVDYNAATAEALRRRPELQAQQLLVRSLCLQLKAAENLDQARFDIVSGYRVNGFGDSLIGGDARLADAHRNLYDGDNTGWNLGFEFFNPVGRRLAKTRKRNVELLLAKAKVVFHEQQAEVGREIAQAVRSLERSLITLQIREVGAKSAFERVESTLAKYEVDGTAGALRALIIAQQAEQDAALRLHAAKIEYASAMTELEFRRGRPMLALMDY